MLFGLDAKIKEVIDTPFSLSLVLTFVNPLYLTDSGKTLH
jgi:hypothetical protein